MLASPLRTSLSLVISILIGGGLGVQGQREGKTESSFGRERAWGMGLVGCGGCIFLCRDCL